MKATEYFEAFKISLKTIGFGETAAKTFYLMMAEIEDKRKAIVDFPEDRRRTSDGQRDFLKTITDLAEAIEQKDRDWAELCIKVNKHVGSNLLKPEGFTELLTMVSPSLLALLNEHRKIKYERLVGIRKRGLDRF